MAAGISKACRQITTVKAGNKDGHFILGKKIYFGGENLISLSI
jgi:hypothetical protein